MNSFCFTNLMVFLSLILQTLIGHFQVVRTTDVPEGSFIIRAHTPMSNIFSCLWFNEVDRFTSRDQLSFGYTFLKLKRTNPKKPLVLHMFKDCERRAITKLFHHRNPLLMAIIIGVCCPML